MNISYKLSTINFHENPFNISCCFTYRQTDTGNDFNRQSTGMQICLDIVQRNIMHQVYKNKSKSTCKTNFIKKN